MPNLVRRTSSNDAQRWIAATFVLIFLIIVGGAFVQRVRKAMRRARARSSSPSPPHTGLPTPNHARVVEPVPQPGQEDLKVANNSDSRLPMSMGDTSLLGIQRTLLESFQMRAVQPELEIAQVDVDSPSLGLGHALTTLIPPNRPRLVPQFPTLPRHLETVSEEDVTAESPATEPRTLDSDSISAAAAVIAPYTYRPSDSTSPMTIEANQIDDNNRSEQGQRHAIQPLQVPQMDPIPYPYRIPEDVEGMDSDSIIPPSELSFEDSLLPPEYNSAWEGGITA